MPRRISKKDAQALLSPADRAVLKAVGKGGLTRSQMGKLTGLGPTTVILCTHRLTGLGLLQPRDDAYDHRDGERRTSRPK